MRIITSCMQKLKIGELTIKYSNLPERYIKRTVEQVEWKNPRGLPQYLPRTIKRTRYRYTTNRPWTHAFYQQNQPGTSSKPVAVEPIINWSFFRGDRVEVLVGKDKGKQGFVSQVFQERNWVIVDGLNTHLKFVGKTKDFPGIAVQSEAPLLVTSEVALVDPSDLKSTLIEWRFTESGEKVRVSSRTGRILSIPTLAEETRDYKTRTTYKEADKDTKEKDLVEITFKPDLKTFEMDIMDKMGITEDRTPAKTYWY